MLNKPDKQIIKPVFKEYYRMPTKTYFGRGQVQILPEYISKSRNTKYLVVMGAHFSNSVINQPLLSDFTKSNKISFYPNQIKKSTFQEVGELVEYVQKGKFDGIIGIGGGAILDCAKVAAALAVNGGVVEDYLINKTKKLSQKGITYIAIPTTSGTGSEVTPWSVVWGDKKYSLSDATYLFPDVAIVDPALTDECPAYITATSGIDAMVQAIESYWNVKHNKISDDYALVSVKTILSSLEKAVNNPTKNSRDEMAWGSLTGGLSFSNNSTTLCHSVSYPMTSHWGVVHGQGTSITLPMFIEYTFDTLGERQKAMLDAFGAKDKYHAAEVVRKLITSIGLQTKLSELGIPLDGLDIIVKEGFDPTRAGNAPRVPTAKELKEMLIKIY